MATSDFQLSGLASGFDWKSMVERLMSIEHLPADRLAAEKARNLQKVTALATLGTKLTALQDSATALGADGAFGIRTAASTTTASTWSGSAGATTPIGSYKINVSQLATAARREGAFDIGSAISPTSDVSGTTLANLPIGSAITEGKFTVNGQQITVALTDSLDTVFQAIATATSNAVTASYDPVADKITLTGTGEVVLGAGNDTSNILAALKLGNNGTPSVTSATRLGTVKTSAPLAAANLGTTITAIDVAGNGAFAINGVSIAYNVNTDTLSGIVAKINQAGAGVTANYDPSNDRVSITNNGTGDIGISVSETAGGLLGALGLTTGGTLVHGENAEFTLNDGATLTSASNTFDATAHGIAGLNVTVNSEGTQTIQVAADTKAMRAKIDDYIAKFNDVQTYLDTVTKVTPAANGKVTAAILADNREIQAWGTSLRNLAFNAVSGSSVITRLDDLGIDFKAGTSNLEIKEGTKLDAALRDKSTNVDAFFHSATTGFSAIFKTFLAGVTTRNTTQQTNLNANNTSLDIQIAEIERRLEQRRAVMESAFIAMETAQSRLQSQQAALTNAFSSNSK
ncbi:MAG: flagellar filament capping protein FliD [Opitutaceae bacterium]